MIIKNNPNPMLKAIDQEKKEEDRSLPPRRVIHPSNKGKLLRYFYHGIIFLFISLMVGLIVWGSIMLTEQG
jgi:hypothetical protein